jgi:predicted aldo/keto reductase-like oxidoreductase
MDNSWDYNDGQSEIGMGKALKDGYGQKVFLMTKLDGRTKDEAAKQIDESLKRLQTDHLDLIQHHEIIRFEDPDRIFAQGGAQEAVLEAKQAGKVRFIGFTGHRTRTSTSTCCRSPPPRVSASTLYKCHSTLWTRISAALKSWFYPSWFRTESACWG